MGTTDLLGSETPERLPTRIPICSRPLPKFNWQPQKEAVPLFSWSGRLGWETASTSGYGEKKGTAWEEGWEENKRRELEWRRCLVWIERAVQRGGGKVKWLAMIWQNTDRGFQLLSGITKMPQSLYFNNLETLFFFFSFFFFILTHPSLILVSYGWWELKMRTNPSNHPRRETHQFWVMDDRNWVICDWKN